MRRIHGWKAGWGVLAACVLAGAASGSPAKSPGAAAIVRPGAAPPVLILFGREGGNMRPLRVTIDAAGTVAAGYPAGGGRTPIHLSKDALDGLLRLAVAEGFPTMPARMIGRGLPDIGGRYITIRTGGVLKTVHVRYLRDPAFDQLYAVLSAAAGLPS